MVRPRLTNRQPFFEDQENIVDYMDDPEIDINHEIVALENENRVPYTTKEWRPGDPIYLHGSTCYTRPIYEILEDAGVHRYGNAYCPTCQVAWMYSDEDTKRPRNCFLCGRFGRDSYLTELSTNLIWVHRL